MKLKPVKRTVTITPRREENTLEFQRASKAATIVKQAFGKLLKFGAISSS